MIQNIVSLKKEYPKAFGNFPDAELHVYSPSNSPEMPIISRPCILMLPGGAYTNISEREGKPVALRLVAQGFCAFVLKYSIMPEKYPVQALQAFAAILYIRDNAAMFAADEAHVAVMGFSAGGHLAGCAATLYGEKYLEAHSA